MLCPYCGKPVDDHDTFCTWCGHRLPVVQKKSRQLGILAIVAVLLVTALFFYFSTRGPMPKGTWVLYDGKGNILAELTLTSAGTYQLQDHQDYSSYASGTVPEIIFSHDYQVTSDGLQWPDTSNGKVYRTEQAHTYRLKNIFGGLFTKVEDGTVFVAGDEAYLCSGEGSDEKIYRLVKPS